MSAKKMPHELAQNTRVGHGVACSHCGKTTYTRTGVCVECKGKGLMYVSPARLPEDYLMACAEELLRRHRQREETLRKLGIGVAA